MPYASTLSTSLTSLLSHFPVCGGGVQQPHALLPYFPAGGSASPSPILPKVVGEATVLLLYFFGLGEMKIVEKADRLSSTVNPTNYRYTLFYYLIEILPSAL